MKIKINGMLQEVAPDSTPQSIILQYNLNPGRVIIELNRNIIPVDQYDQICLKSDDRLEIIQVVGGG